MASNVRLGIIGLGHISQQHIKHVCSDAVAGCEITALCSRSGDELARDLGAKHFVDYRALIDSDLCDAVLVATPTLSIGEAEQLLARVTGEQVFGLMLNQRMEPVFARMKPVMESGALGELQRTHWTMTNWFRPEVYFQVSDWRATWRGEGGGLLVNQCIHNLDIFQWLCGMPSRVNGFCSFGKYHDIEVEDEATAYFEYSNGATGVFVGSTGEAPGVNRFDIVGDLGMLSYDGEQLILTHNQPGTAAFSRSTRNMFGQPDATVEDLTPSETVNQHALIIQNFVDAISADTQLIAPAAEGLNSLAIANAILLSAWTGGAVDLPLDSAAYQQALNQRLAESSLREKSDIKVAGCSAGAETVTYLCSLE